MILDNKTALLDKRSWPMAHEKVAGLRSVHQKACRQSKLPFQTKHKHAKRASKCGLRGSTFVSETCGGSVKPRLMEALLTHSREGPKHPDSVRLKGCMCGNAGAEEA